MSNVLSPSLATIMVYCEGNIFNVNAFILCRFFRTDRMEVMKRVKPWSTYATSTGVGFDSLKQLYEATSGASGVVHAAQAPVLDADKYTVSLRPVGMQYLAAIPVDEAAVKMVAHGLLHGLAAIHQVRHHSTQNLAHHVVWVLTGMR